MDTSENDGNRIDNTRRFVLLTTASAGLTGIVPRPVSAQTQRKESDSDITTTAQASPTEFISAVSTDEVNQAISSVSYEGESEQLAVFNSSIQNFPLANSDEFGVMSSGIAELASGEPRDFVSKDVEGLVEPDFSPDGFTAFNVATVDIGITIPNDVSALAFDYKFGTEENPEFLDSQFQDFFESFLIAPDGEIEPLSTLPDGSPVTVNNADRFSNSPNGTSQNPLPPLPEPADTSYNAVTDLQTASYDVSSFSGNEITLRLRIADASDPILDSGIFIDNLRFTDTVDIPDGFSTVESTLGQYKSAVKTAIEADIRAQAMIEASFYEEYGDDYVSNSRDFWGYKAGIVDGDELSSDLVDSTDSLLRDLESEVYDDGTVRLEDEAEMIYEFKSELYDALSSSDDTITTAYEYYRGTADQNNYFQINGQTIEEYIDSFSTDFDTVQENILSEIQTIDPDQSQIEQYVSSIQNATDELKAYATTTETNAADLITAIENQNSDEVDIDIIGGKINSQETDINTGDAFLSEDTVSSQAILGGIGVGGVLIGGVSAGLSLGKSYSVFKIGGGILAVGATVSLVAAAVKATFLKIANIIKHIGKEVLKEWAKERAKNIFERNFIIEDDIDGSITTVVAPDVTQDDISEEALFPTWWNTLVELINATFGTNWSKVSHGIQTAAVTVENTGDETLYPVIDATIQGLGSDGQYDVIERPIIWDNTPQKELQPGEIATYEFTYRVNLSEYTHGRLSVSLKDEYQLSSLTKSVAFFDVGDTQQSAEPVELFSGSVSEGQSKEISHIPAPDTETFTCNLNYSTNYLDLHLYDNTGNHTGLNYDTGEIENQIPGSKYSGRDTGDTGFEWISVSGVPNSEFTIETVAPTVTTIQSNKTVTTTKTSPTSDAMSVDISGTVETQEFDPRPPAIDFERDNITKGVEPGQTVEIPITLAETNGDTGADTVTVTADGLTANESSIPSEKISIEPSTIELPADATQPLLVHVDIPTDAQPKTYETTLAVTSDDSTVNTDTQLIIQLSVDPTTPGSPTEFYSGTDGEIDDTDIAQAVQDWSNGEGWFAQTENPNTDIAQLVQTWASS